MKKSTTAALLSALVFPGIGHIYLKKYITGSLLACFSLSSGYYLISKTIDIAVNISEKIQSGDIPLDMASISTLASEQANNPDAYLRTIATTVFIICWLIGIIDSYRIAGPKQYQG